MNCQTDAMHALLQLSCLPYIGSIKARLLIEYFGSPEAALEADASDISHLPGFGEKIVSNWNTWKKDSRWESNFDLATKKGARILPFTSAEYPKRLLELPDFPLVLYVKGDVAVASKLSIAVIGTRQCSIYGKEMAERISSELASMGYVVMSGLARGVDTAAHQGAVQEGKTVAVIGSGLCDIYPKENWGLSEQIVNTGGALISEFPMMTPPDRQNFPQRNRIVSALCSGAFLVEAPERSGAMLTMQMAEKQGRKLFALPGRVDVQTFKGNHDLIKRRKAYLVENARDIASYYEELFPLENQSVAKVKSLPRLEVEERKLLASMPLEEVSYEALELATKLPVTKLNVLLMSLVLKKVIREYPGKMYRKDSVYYD